MTTTLSTIINRIAQVSLFQSLGPAELEEIAKISISPIVSLILLKDPAKLAFFTSFKSSSCFKMFLAIGKISETKTDIQKFPGFMFVPLIE